MLKTPTPAVPDQRGNFIFRGDDATLFIKLCHHMDFEKGSRVAVTDVLLDAMRCLAEQKGVK